MDDCRTFTLKIQHLPISGRSDFHVFDPNYIKLTMWHHLARSRYLHDVLQVSCLMLTATGAVVAIRYGHPQPHIHKRIARRIMDQVGKVLGEDHLSNEKNKTPTLVGWVI